MARLIRDVSPKVELPSRRGLGSGDAELRDQLRSALRRHEGVHLIAVAGGDLEARSRRLVSGGWQMQPPVTLRRPAPGTAEGEIVWHVLRPESGQMAEGRVQFVTCATPRSFWSPAAALRHPNGATGISGVWVTVDPDGRLTVVEPVHLTARHGQVQAVERQGAAVSFGQVLGEDRRRVHEGHGAAGWDEGIRRDSGASWAITEAGCAAPRMTGRHVLTMLMRFPLAHASEVTR